MDIFFKVKTKKARFIFSILSAFTYLLGYSIIMESGNLSVCFVSCVHIKQNRINIQFGNIMRHFILLSLSSFSPLFGTMESHFGSRLYLLANTIVIEIALIFFIFKEIYGFFIY